MSMGAERVEAQPRRDIRRSIGEPVEAPAAESREFNLSGYEEETQPPRGRRGLAVLLVVLAIAWIAVAGFAMTSAWPGPSLPAWTGWAATISAPLILLALIWLIYGGTSRQETERFTHAVMTARRESQALEGLLAIITDRLEENRGRLSEEAARLMSLGEEASDRLGRVTHYLSRETAELDRRAQALDNAAAHARVDIGVLMSDLPRAEEQARMIAESLKAAGLTAHEQAAALEGQLASLTARSREADEGVGGAAQRLGAQIARIESGADAASSRLEQAAAQMNGVVDSAMSRASESIEQARLGLEAQGQAMRAMIEQSRAAFEEAGADSSRALGERLNEIGARLEALAGQLAAQERASKALVAGLATQIVRVETQFDLLGQAGEEQSNRLSNAIESLRAAAASMQQEIVLGQTASSALIDCTHQMSAALATLSNQLRDEIPAALGGVEGQAERTTAAVQAAMPPVESIQAAAALAAESMAESEASLGRQRQSMEDLLASIGDTLSRTGEQVRALDAGIGDADSAAARLAQQTTPQLVEALARVRETANQAAAHAREAIAQSIPESVAALANASREAMAGVLGQPVQEQLAAIATESERAMETARQAGDRLTGQLLTIGQTAGALEERITQHNAAREEQAAEQLTRRVSLLIEALNSTAIDVNKLLSNEVADTAWAAYLKGDRGVFTRRAVRLLDRGEAREIQRHYREEPHFREQVDRYIHDFEAMLRRVLADREGPMLGVTLLSSDMGKLYVALAQAIQRFR